MITYTKMNTRLEGYLILYMVMKHFICLHIANDVLQLRKILEKQLEKIFD